MPRINANTSALTSGEQGHGQKTHINIVLPNQLVLADVPTKVLSPRAEGYINRFNTIFQLGCLWNWQIGENEITAYH